MCKAKERRGGGVRKEPLLPTSAVGSPRSNGCGACGRLVLLLLPVLGCACLIGSLLFLASRSEVPISETFISQLIADCEPKMLVLLPIYVGASLIFVVTAMRNVQINVYHRRRGSETRCTKATNIVAAVSNILAYSGFVVLVVYDIDGPGHDPLIHWIGASMYFVLSGVYAALHAVLLCGQAHYPLFTKIIFTVVPIATVTCSIMFAVDMTEYCEFEWFAVALSAVTVGLISILFLVDPVDDELRDFFCCRRLSGDSGRPSK